MEVLSDSALKAYLAQHFKSFELLASHFMVVVPSSSTRVCIGFALVVQPANTLFSRLIPIQQELCLTIKN